MNKLLVFSAHWCRPCQMMKPVLDSMDNANIIRYDLDLDRDKVEKYRVPGVPCFILVDENDQELEISLGVKSKEFLEELLSR